MNTTEAAELLTGMRAFWRNVDASDIAANAWQAVLHDISLSDAQAALYAYARGVSGSDFPPKPADLLRMMVRATLNLPTEDDAWRMVMGEVRRVGRVRSVFHAGERYVLRPAFPVIEVALAAEAVGWSVIVDGPSVRADGSSNATYVQDMFRKAYNRYVEQARSKALMIARDDLEHWRQGLASTLKVVEFGMPKGLFELGAPPSYAALVDGSGPTAPAIVAELTPVIPPAPVVSDRVANERRAVIDARTRMMTNRARTPGSAALPPPQSLSGYQRKESADGQ